MQQVDFLVVGGGLFGVFTALYLAEKKYKVCLLEKEPALFTKASKVNQARLHGGYHYPRSIATALMAHEHLERFTREHKPFIHAQFDNYYAIDKFASYTTNQQFERFCKFVQLPASKMRQHSLFNFDHIEALYRTEEYSFDPVLIAEYYQSKLVAHPSVSILLNAKIIQAEKLDETWRVEYFLNGNPQVHYLKTAAVINASYAGTNSINALFGIKELDLVYELAEIAYVRSAELAHTGLTVMDGPYASCMPYGFSGLLSLSSVTYTPHAVSYDPLPGFDCQHINTNCKPTYISDCTACTARPQSNQVKMIHQIKKYLSLGVSIEYVHSLFTIKTKLKSSYIDDGRPTELSKMSEQPAYYCLFSGKINSIYEIEKLIPQ